MAFSYLFVLFTTTIFLGEYQGIVNADTTSHAENGLCKPEAVHLAFGNSSQEMVLMWATQGECSMEVQYAPHPWHLNLTVKGDIKKLDCGSPNGTQYMHRVVLQKLRPGSTIFYRLISNGIGEGPFYFKVPDLDETSHFIVFNELGATHQKAFVKCLVNEAYSRSFTSLFYLSEPQTLLSEVDGGSFLQTLREPVVSLPLMTGSVQGAETDLQCEGQMFSIPGFRWPLATPVRWYSHDIGTVHVIRFSPRVFLESDSKEAKAMQAWMVTDLTKANLNRKQIPWVIAMGLDPMYCTDATHSITDCAKNDSKIRHGLEDLFYSFAVDLVIEQQDGPYERTWPHYKGVVVAKTYMEPAAPIEIIMGSGKMPAAKSEPANSTDAQSTVPEWSAVTIPHGGESYSRLTVVNASHLHWEVLSVSDGSMLDEIWVVQPQHGNFSLSSLPCNVSHQINQSIIAMGGKPGTYDFIGNLDSDEESPQGEGWSKYSLWFGLALVGAAIGIGLGTVTVRSYLRRRRGNAGRRWQEVDRQGSGGHFYSVASDTDSDDENDNDFEIDMFERSSKSGSKLLTSY